MEDNSTLDETKLELAAIDDRIGVLKENLKLAEDLEWLHNTEQFQNVILGAYLEKESERIYGVLIDPTHRLKRDVMENLMDKLTSVRSIKQFFGTLMTNASMASEQIEEEEAHRLTVTKRDSIIDVEVA